MNHAYSSSLLLFSIIDRRVFLLLPPFSLLFSEYEEVSLGFEGFFRRRTSPDDDAMEWMLPMFKMMSVYKVYVSTYLDKYLFSSY